MDIGKVSLVIKIATINKFMQIAFIQVRDTNGGKKEDGWYKNQVFNKRLRRSLKIAYRKQRERSEHIILRTYLEILVFKTSKFMTRNWIISGY